jgi:hypothetical protein
MLLSIVELKLLSRYDFRVVFACQIYQPKGIFVKMEINRWISMISPDA